MVNLATKYGTAIHQKFTKESFIKGRLSDNVDFVGARTARIYTVGTVELNSYDRNGTGNRFGVPEEVGDFVQELTMSQDIGFSARIDKGNGKDQTINKAGQFLKVQMSEKVIPAYDKYVFGRLGYLAGVQYGSATAIDAANAIDRLCLARTSFANNMVPSENRTWYVTPNFFNWLVKSDHFVHLNTIGSPAITKGQIGTFFGSPVVEVPDAFLPAGMNFMLVHKNAAIAPEKLWDAKTHIDPPGVSGQQVDGRFYFDAFIIGAQANGVYVDFDSTVITKSADVTIDPATGEVEGVTAGNTVKYTTDGSDPRYSMSAQTGTTITAATGATMKAYQFKDGDATVYPSNVVTVVHA